MQKRRYVIAHCNFIISADSPNNVLPLCIGDKLCVTAAKSAWCYGYKVESPSICGIFPEAAIQETERSSHIPSLNGCPQPSCSTEGESFAAEIAAVLHTWWIRIKELYSKYTELHWLDEVLAAVDELLRTRKKVVAGGVPSEEMAQLILSTSAVIDRINILLSLNVVVREPSGQPANVENFSIIQLYDEHRKVQQNALSNFRTKAQASSDVYSILFEVHSVVLHEKFDCEIVYQLYDVVSGSFLSESLRFIWSHEKKKLADSSVKALIRDVSAKDTNRKLVLLSRIAKIAPIEAANGSSKKQYEVIPSSLRCRQAIAFDIIDLQQLFENDTEHIEKMRFFNKEDSLHDTLKKLSVLEKFTPMKLPPVVRPDDDFKAIISIHRLDGPSKDLNKLYPHVFARQPPVYLLKTDLAMFLHPEEPRNELFITLMSAEIYGKFPDKNIECRLSILNDQGDIISDCFENVTPKGATHVSTCFSYVVPHDEKPRWCEQIKIRLPTNLVNDVHIKFSFWARKQYDKSKPEKGPIAVAFLKILEKCVLLKDDEHNLLVYKIDGSIYEEHNTLYLGFPENRKVLADLGSSSGKTPQNSTYSLMEKSSFVVRSHACSSILTQDPDVLNMLKWKDGIDPRILDNSLITIANSLIEPNLAMRTEIMKNMEVILDTLFEILSEHRSSPLAAFDIIVAILRLTEEPQYPLAPEALKFYLSRFPFTAVIPRLIASITNYLLMNESQKNDRMMNALKVFGLLVQFIVRAKFNADRMQEEVNDFFNLIDDMLDSFVRLMAEKRERIVAQNTALRHFPAAIKFLYQVFDSDHLTNHLVNMMNAFGPNIVHQERLQFVGQVIESELFLHPLWRQTLFPHCIVQLQMYLDVEEISCRDTAKPIVSAGKILGKLVDLLWPKRALPIGTEDEFITVLRTCYRPLVRSMVLISDPDIADERGLLFTVILAIYNRLSASSFQHYLALQHLTQDKIDLLMEIIQLLYDGLTNSPFSSTWASMIRAQNKIIDKMLKFLRQYIGEGYIQSEMYDVFHEYIITLVAFINSLGTTRREELSINDEENVALRQSAANELRSIWYKPAAGYKIWYVSQLIGPFLQVALIPDDNIRSAIIPIFHDMMQVQFHHKHSFTAFSNELCAQLDSLVMKYDEIGSFRTKFVKLMKQLFKSDEVSEGAADSFISQVKKLLGLLMEYRYARENMECVEVEMSLIKQLMSFYSDNNQIGLHTAYVYKLYDLHISYSNDIEAAFTLFMHAVQLDWSDHVLPKFLIDKALNQHCATERQLKELLFNRIIDLFAKGDMWENAIQFLMELQNIYYTQEHDYEKLSDLLIRQAELFRKIDKENRAFFYFYVVGFYGQGYPAFLNGRQYVFRSDQLERHPDFLQRMKQMYGNPETHTTMDDCSHLSISPGKHMQVFKVDPVCSKSKYGENVNPTIKEYERNYNIQKFEFCRTHTKESKWTQLKDTEITRVWVTKRIVVTAEKLPNTLRFSQIVSVSLPIEISPLELAVQEMRRKNNMLLESAAKVRHNPMFSTRNFAGEITGVVQAAVQGGIKNFEIFFSEKCHTIYTEEDCALAAELKQLVVHQVAIVEYCIFAHGERAEADKTIHNMLVESFREHKDYVERLYGKMTSMLPHGSSIYDNAIEPVPNPTLRDREKKPSSASLTTFDESITSASQHSFISSGSSTLKKGIHKMLGTTPRKSFSSISSQVLKHTEKPAEMLDKVLKGDSVENFKRYVKNSPIGSPLRRSNISQNSMDGVRLRSPSAPKSPSFVMSPPPVPPRPSSPITGTMRKISMTEKRPLPPTPNID